MITYARHLVYTDVGPRIYIDLDLTNYTYNVENFKASLKLNNYIFCLIEEDSNLIRLFGQTKKIWRSYERPKLLNIFKSFTDEKLISFLQRIPFIRNLWLKDYKDLVDLIELESLLEASETLEEVKETQGYLSFID